MGVNSRDTFFHLVPRPSPTPLAALGFPNAPQGTPWDSWCSPWLPRASSSSWCSPKNPAGLPRLACSPGRPYVRSKTQVPPGTPTSQQWPVSWGAVGVGGTLEHPRQKVNVQVRKRGRGRELCCGISICVSNCQLRVLRNHVWRNPIVWISSASPQTTRVQLIARHLFSTSILQRVLQCEIEKNGQKISPRASARLQTTTIGRGA